MSEADQVATPNGGVARRCTACSSRTGERCKKSARVGFEVCATHGAGTQKRQENGSRAAPGRARTHGLYATTSNRTLADLRAEVEALDLDLDDTDAEVVTIKAILLALFRRSDWLEQQSAMLESAVEAVERVLGEAVVVKDGLPGVNELTVAQARQVAAGLANGQRLLSNITSFTHALLDANLKSINAAKIRSDTRALKAQVEALAHFGTLCRGARQILWDLNPEPTITPVEYLRQVLAYVADLDERPSPTMYGRSRPSRRRSRTRRMRSSGVTTTTAPGCCPVRRLRRRRPGPLRASP